MGSLRAFGRGFRVGCRCSRRVELAWRVTRQATSTSVLHLGSIQVPLWWPSLLMCCVKMANDRWAQKHFKLSIRSLEAKEANLNQVLRNKIH